MGRSLHESDIQGRRGHTRETLGERERVRRQIEDQRERERQAGRQNSRSQADRDLRTEGRYVDIGAVNAVYERDPLYPAVVESMNHPPRDQDELSAIIDILSLSLSLS
ncbi:hypothetical protein KIPB_016132, partial [Kipferlia bialata]|eukprot:g16132.t1